MKKIALGGGKFAIVDAKYFDWLNRYKWSYGKRGASEYAYRHVYGGGKRLHSIYMHRYIANAGPDDDVDHKDGNGLLNTENNLRLCEHKHNMYNQRPDVRNTSGYKGVHPSGRSKKWVAQIGHHYKRIHLGTFENKEDAARAYDAKAKELFGEFAWLNFPEEKD